jgi:hypothetical protein
MDIEQRKRGECGSGILHEAPFHRIWRIRFVRRIARPIAGFAILMGFKPIKGLGLTWEWIGQLRRVAVRTNTKPVA